MKLDIFWDMRACRLVGPFQRFGGICFIFKAEDGGKNFLRNISDDLPDYTVSYRKNTFIFVV
jgi:hypothetical protein